jgi:hypothetical protein
VDIKQKFELVSQKLDEITVLLGEKSTDINLFFFASIDMGDKAECVKFARFGDTRPVLYALECLLSVNLGLCLHFLPEVLKEVAKSMNEINSSGQQIH